MIFSFFLCFGQFNQEVRSEMWKRRLVVNWANWWDFFLKFFFFLLRFRSLILNQFVTPLVDCVYEKCQIVDTQINLRFILILTISSQVQGCDDKSNWLAVDDIKLRETWRSRRLLRNSEFHYHLAGLIGCKSNGEESARSHTTVGNGKNIYKISTVSDNNNVLL